MNRQQDRQAAAAWARKVLDQNPLILDTETTGFDGYIVQLAIIDMHGNTLVDTYVNPLTRIEPGAIQVHGITWNRVAGAPTFKDINPQLESLLAGRTIAVYNMPFDRRVLARECERIKTKHAASLYGATWEDIMVPYAAVIGQEGKNGEYKWQKLPKGDHSAVGDCRAALKVLQLIADQNLHPANEQKGLFD